MNDLFNFPLPLFTSGKTILIFLQINVLGNTSMDMWSQLLSLNNLVELDLVTMQFENVKVLLKAVGHVLKTLTLEMDEEQGNGSEIVHIGR